ncbi:biotin--[acetyl-CoA-carboxylase] ligase [Salibaculum sp.]|uniref:biotin--[acetyl-CoA-carboxylase] ligase n=1 Tax=Salibaculum sp. TaxID=2855480 RepID=UPI002B4A6EA2|nr:biotin--[acetyl-CoA-carboxylase] ligase [Salibaculum sp.]HKL68722.1 biotin--[acetyl-CoA-carboxylase] ligase [Salibaculum sp.]
MQGSWPEGVGRIVLPRTDSTLSEAARRFAGLPAPTWILAHEQTAARGRRGRAWANPQGNFAATYVMRLDRPAGEAALRSFVMALALRDALGSATGRTDLLALKWPNDVLMSEGKLAGILLETVMLRGQIAGLAIGVGVNLFAVPDAGSLDPGAVSPVSVHAETGVSISDLEFLGLLARAYAGWEHDFTTYGFAPIREAWLRNAARQGQVITARLPGEEVIGTFETVDENGYLVLTTAKGARRIAAADVFF